MRLLMMKAFKLYTEQVAACGLQPLLSFTRAWRLVKFIDGNPYGVSHLVDYADSKIPDTTHQAAFYQGARVTRIAGILAAGLR